MFKSKEEKMLEWVIKNPMKVEKKLEEYTYKIKSLKLQAENKISFLKQQKTTVENCYEIAQGNVEYKGKLDIEGQQKLINWCFQNSEKLLNKIGGLNHSINETVSVTNMKINYIKQCMKVIEYVANITNEKFKNEMEYEDILSQKVDFDILDKSIVDSTHYNVIEQAKVICEGRKEKKEKETEEMEEVEVNEKLQDKEGIDGKEVKEEIEVNEQIQTEEEKEKENAEENNTPPENEDNVVTEDTTKDFKIGVHKSFC